MFAGGLACFRFLTTRPSTTAAQTMAMVSMPAKGMSVAAACEKPIMPTLVGKRSSSQRAHSSPYVRQASHASANVASKAEIALGRRAATSGAPGAEEFEEQSASPVEKRRFFEPRLAIKPWSNPVAGFRHVARDPGVTRFVGADKANHTQMAEIADVESDQDQHGPADALCQRRGDFAGRL